MKPRTQLPGSQWLLWLRSSTLRVGLLTGIYLSVVFSAWVLVANRLPWTANFAAARNTGASVLLLVLMCIPILRFLRSPLKMFACGLTACAALTWTFLMLGLFFDRLYSRIAPLQLFLLGTVGYGFCAVICWVIQLLFAARHQPVIAPRRRI